MFVFDCRYPILFHATNITRTTVITHMYKRIRLQPQTKLGKYYLNRMPWAILENLVVSTILAHSSQYKDVLPYRFEEKEMLEMTYAPASTSLRQGLVVLAGLTYPNCCFRSMTAKKFFLGRDFESTGGNSKFRYPSRNCNAGQKISANLIFNSYLESSRELMRLWVPVFIWESSRELMRLWVPVFLWNF
jgi:hypothetical protein